MRHRYKPGPSTSREEDAHTKGHGKLPRNDFEIPSWVMQAVMLENIDGENGVLESVDRTRKRGREGLVFNSNVRISPAGTILFFFLRVGIGVQFLGYVKIFGKEILKRKKDQMNRNEAKARAKLARCVFRSQELQL